MEERWRRGADQAQGPPGDAQTETGTELVAALEQRGDAVLKALN